MPDYTVSSTTDTQEQVNQAAGAAAEPEVEETPEQETPEQEQEVKEAKPEAEKPTYTPKAEKRIGKLTAEKYRLANENATLRDQLSRLQQQTAAPAVEQAAPAAEAKPAAQEVTAKPVPANFETYEDFVEALADWKSDQKVKNTLKTLEEAEKQAQQQEQQNEILSTFKDRVETFREEHPDYDEVVSKIVGPESVGMAITQMENGPEVAYYLGKNPQVCKELMSMNSLSALTTLGRIGATLEGDARPGAQGRKTAADRPPVSSSAPPPIRTLTGHATKNTKSLDEMDYQEYRKYRDQQEKSRWAR